MEVNPLSVWKTLLVFLLLSASSGPSDTNAFAFMPPSASKSCPRSTLERPHTLQYISLSMVANDKVDLQRKKSRKRRKRRSQDTLSLQRTSSLAPTEDAIQTWRVFGVHVHPDLLVDFPQTSSTKAEKLYLSPPVLQALCSRLKLAQPDQLLDVRVVRRSLDARKKRPSGQETGPRFMYVLDVDVSHTTAHQLGFRIQSGKMELLTTTTNHNTTTTTTAVTTSIHDNNNNTTTCPSKLRVIVVGAGPAGLFCALTLAQSGLVVPILLERGQPVESRGRHIGALMHRRSLDSESNYCFGEGGAGTWRAIR